MRLQVKLLALYLSTSAIIILAFGSILYVRLWNERLLQIQKTIAIQLDHFDVSLLSFFGQVEGDVKELASNELILTLNDENFTNFTSADSSDFKYNYSDIEKNIVRIFNTHRLTHKYVSSVYMGRENGSFVRSHPRERPTQYDPRERPWYRMAISKPGEVVRTDAYSSLTTKDINIGIVKALTDSSGRVFGVLGIDVTLVNLTKFIQDFKVQPSGEAFMIGRHGVILANQGMDQLGNPLRELSPEISALIATGDEGIQTAVIQGRKHYLFFQRSSEEDWKIAVLVPAVDIAHEISGHILWIVISLAGGLLLLSILTLSGLNLVIIRPLKKLTHATNIITQTGNLNYTIYIPSHDEIGELANAFGTMVSTLDQSQKSLHNARQQLENIIEFLPDATFVIDRDRRVVAWNRQCEILTGVAKESMLGRGDYIYAEPFYKKRCPILIDMVDESIPVLEERYKYVRRSGDTIAAESFNQHLLGGKGAYIWGVAGPLFDKDGQRCGTIEVFRDITEQKRIEIALQESEIKYRELVEHANSIILRWTYDGRIIFLNEFGLRFFGYATEEIIGRHVLGTIVPLSDSIGHDMERLMSDICADPLAFEQSVNENVRRNGERVWIAWTNRIVRDEQGQVSQILSVGTDITPLKRAEEAIRELNTNLEQRVAVRTAELAVAKDRAESADRLKSAFLATMSHELRTPLNSIIGFTGIILQEMAGPLYPEQRKQLKMVYESARHLLALINDVLDISKIEAGQLEVCRETFDLRASIYKVVGIIQPLLDKKALAFHIEHSASVSSIISDQRRVEQILLNLLNNAIKFTERGSITLKTAVESDQLRIIVADTGIGIKLEDFNKLFQPFRQIDSGLSRQHEGTGLGLAICRRLAELLGGSINATSEWEKGSVFTLTLPLRETMES